MMWLARLMQLSEQESERYLPTAFNSGLTLLDKLNKAIEYLNQTIEAVNTIGEYVDKNVNEQNAKVKSVRDDFEVLKSWLENEGLEERTVSVLNDWFDSGKLAQILSEDLLGLKANQSEFIQTQQNVLSLQQRINELVIPLSPDNSNLEVTDAHHSEFKGTGFSTIGMRMNEVEKELGLSFIESNNKFFDSHKLEKHHITMLGVPEPSDSYFSFIDIKVTPNSYISTRGTNRIVYKKGDKSYHSNVSPEVSGYSGLVPDGAEWASFRCQETESFINPYQLNFSQGLLPYDVPKKTLSEHTNLEKVSGKLSNGNVDAIETTKNQLKYTDVLWDTGFSSTTGLLIENNNSYHTTVKIPVNPGDKITLIGFNRIQTYSLNGDVSGGFDTPNGYEEPTTYTIPNGRYFMRLRWEKVRTGNQQFEFGESLSGSYSIYDKLKPMDLSEQEDIKEMSAIIEKFGNSYEYRYPDTTFEGIYNTDDVNSIYTDFASATTEDVHTLFDNLMSDYGDYITRIDGGNEATGLPLRAYQFKPKFPSSGSYKKVPKGLIICGIHGYEHMNPLATYLMVKNMCEKWDSSNHLEVLRFNVELTIIPVANPYGFNNFIRKNSNNIDLNRNFDTSNFTIQDPSAVNFGGTVKGSEIETQFMMSLMDENEFDFVYDFHNFQEVEPANQFLWIPTGRAREMEIAEPFIAKMTRKWADDFSFVNRLNFVGYTNQTNAGGSSSSYAREKGVYLSSTIEIRDRWVNDSNGVPYDSNVCKAGEEAIVNWIIFNIRELLK